MKKQLQTTFSTRQHMLSDEFEIYYYNGYPSAAVGAHVHDNYEFYFFLDGNVDITIDGNRFPIKTGDFIVFPPGVSHYPTILNKEKPYRRFVLWVSREYCSKLLAESKDYVYLMQYASINKKYLYSTDTITFNELQSAIFKLIEEQRSNNFGKEAEIRLQINSLILSLNRIVYEQNTNSAVTYGKNLYMNLCNFISVHLEEDLSLERLAGEFYVSKFHISHAFKDNIGLSVHQYITKKRLIACKNALLTDMPISKIYEQYGFNDYSAFYRAFKKEYGISPKEFKERYKY